MKTTLGQKFGGTIIALGMLGFIAGTIISFTDFSGLDEGALPATSFFLIIVGMAFTFPSMLEEAKGEVSTMRIVVFVVVMVFAVVHLKIGWNAGTFKDFQIDQTWVYILGLAFGSKAFQKFSEKEDNESAAETKRRLDALLKGKEQKEEV
jgi:predicted membrane channel-forming protein YqfA (hemolysin III family)